MPKHLIPTPMLMMVQEYRIYQNIFLKTVHNLETKKKREMQNKPLSTFLWFAFFGSIASGWNFFQMPSNYFPCTLRQSWKCLKKEGTEFSLNNQKIEVICKKMHYYYIHYSSYFPKQWQECLDAGGEPFEGGLKKKILSHCSK